MPPEQDIKDVKRKHSAWVMQQPGVCGFGIEKDEQGNFVLAVHLDSQQANAGGTIPDSFDGYPVKRFNSGPFAKQ